MERITYEITSNDNWDVPNLTIIESDSKYALKFTLNGEDVTDKSIIVQACEFYSDHCRYVMRRFNSGKRFNAAKNELKYLTEYAKKLQ